MIGSFLPSYQLEQKTKKPRYETTPISMPAAAIPIPSTGMDDTHGSSDHGRHASTPKPNLASSSFRGDSWSGPPHFVAETRNANTDINISLPGG